MIFERNLPCFSPKYFVLECFRLTDLIRVDYNVYSPVLDSVSFIHDVLLLGILKYKGTSRDDIYWILRHIHSHILLICQCNDTSLAKICQSFLFYQKSNLNVSIRSSQFLAWLRIRVDCTRILSNLTFFTASFFSFFLNNFFSTLSFFPPFDIFLSTFLSTFPPFYLYFNFLYDFRLSCSIIFPLSYLSFLPLISSFSPSFRHFHLFIYEFLCLCSHIMYGFFFC